MDPNIIPNLRVPDGSLFASSTFRDHALAITALCASSRNQMMQERKHGNV